MSTPADVRKLTKTAAKGGYTGALILSECGEWAANGHWACRLDTLDGFTRLPEADRRTQQALLRAAYGEAIAAEPDATGPDIARFVPGEELKEWERLKRTSWFIDLTPARYKYTPTRCVLYVGTASIAVVQERYADFVQRGELYSPTQDPERGHVDSTLVGLGTSGEVDTVVMPHNIRRDQGEQARALAKAIREQWRAEDNPS